MKHLRAVILFVFILAGWVLSACQPAATPAPDVSALAAYDIRPLKEVSGGELPQIVDITDVDAILLFESTIPLACSVVYEEWMR